MPTDNRRIAAYLPKNIDERLEAFKSDRGLKGDSQALIIILSDFFGVSQKVTYQGSSELEHRVDALESKFSQFESELLSELRKELLENRSSSIEQVKIDVRDELLSELRSELPKHETPPGQLELLAEPDKEIEKTTDEPLSGLLSKPLSEVASELSPLPGRELSRRFGLHEQVVTNKKNLLKDMPEKFTQWSKAKDPDSIAWEFRPETKLFHPLPEYLSKSSDRGIPD